jgi:ATP-dependent HslUV protease subunit HslV
VGQQRSLNAPSQDVSYTITGNGDVLEAVDGVIGIGSGGTYALAAARALIDQDMDVLEIGKKSMTIAGDICVYTNHNWTIETIGFDEDKEKEDEEKA